MRDSILRLLRLRDATPAERAAALWTAAFFFCVLSAYYLLRSLRDEVGTVFGKEHLKSLFTLTFVIITVLNWPYMLLANRLPARRFLPLVLHGFVVSFVAIAAGLALSPPLQQDVFEWSRPECLVGAFFFSWVTAFSVCGVVLVWVHAVDFFTTQQSKRLFGLVSVGGTLGAIVASALAIAASSMARPVVLVAAGVALEFGVVCYHRSLRACEAMRQGGAPQARQRVASAGVLHGLALLFRSRYLLAIASFVLISAIVATWVYYELNGLAAAQIKDPSERRVMFSQINLCQNLASLLLQVWVTRLALLRLGVAVMLCLMPAVSLLGFSLAATVPVVVLFAGYEVLRRTTQFAFDKPAREVLFTPLGLEEKYKSKAFIDTVVLRTGDLVGSWVNDLLVRIKLGGLPLVVAAVPVLLGWGALGWWLGRQCQKKERRSADAAG